MLDFSNAKINLGLNVLEKRIDGYHNIETCFYPIPYSDIIEIIPASETRFTQTGNYIPGDPGDNVCLKAYQKLKEAFSLPPVNIHLHKVVPIGAGLGGGSANAAWCLKILNELFQLHLRVKDLERWATQIGSDCAFFVESKPCIGLDKGDRLESIELDLAGYHLVIVTPDIHISSAVAYSSITPRRQELTLSQVLSANPVEKWKGLIHNDFEVSVFSKHPAIGELKKALYRQGALLAMLSGSGSSVFGLFDQKPASDPTSQGLKIWQCRL